MPEETVTLRDAARRLTLAKNPKAKSLRERDLLSLLKSGDLKAGFYILDGTWIEIPLTHWVNIRSNELRLLHRRSGDQLSGTYTLRANQFPDQIVKIISRQPETPDKTKLSAEVTARIIDAGDKSYEVTIKSTDFTKYLDKRGIQEGQPTVQSGRHQKKWRDICKYIAAYVGAHYRDRPEVDLKIKESSQAIYHLANAAGLANLPSADTIKEQVSKAKELLETSEFDLKKR